MLRLSLKSSFCMLLNLNVLQKPMNNEYTYKFKKWFQMIYLIFLRTMNTISNRSRRWNFFLPSKFATTNNQIMISDIFQTTKSIKTWHHISQQVFWKTAIFSWKVIVNRFFTLAFKSSENRGKDKLSKSRESLFKNRNEILVQSMAKMNVVFAQNEIFVYYSFVFRDLQWTALWI